MMKYPPSHGVPLETIGLLRKRYPGLTIEAPVEAPEIVF
jgi:hypothetical protein